MIAHHHHILRALLLFLVLAISYTGSFSQPGIGGEIRRHKFISPAVESNTGGENPIRQISVYLPPEYDQSKQHYPVIYFLHGYGVNDSLLIEWLDLKRLLDQAMISGRIKPVIFVLPNSETRYQGSFYTNSTLTGNWADFIAKDVVSFIDKTYRTIPHRESRGLCGHSMGGNGALKIAMQYADVYHAVYALSPGALHWAAEFNINSQAFRKIQSIKDETEFLKTMHEPTSPEDPAFWIPLMACLGRTFSPDQTQLPHQAKFPVTYEGKDMIVNSEVLTLWERNFPINMISNHLAELKSLSGIKIDWGRNDEFPHIPITCLEFSKKLEAFRIPHYAEEYIGGHVNKLGGSDGRILQELLPFFDIHLKGEPIQINSKAKKRQ